MCGKIVETVFIKYRLGFRQSGSAILVDTTYCYCYILANEYNTDIGTGKVLCSTVQYNVFKYCYTKYRHTAAATAVQCMQIQNTVLQNIFVKVLR